MIKQSRIHERTSEGTSGRPKTQLCTGYNMIKQSRIHEYTNEREDSPWRAVWAECRDETKLVTVIDTVTDHPCGPC